METWELVVYADGDSHLTLYTRDEYGDLHYIGGEFLDKKETNLVVLTLRSKGKMLEYYINQVGRWVKDPHRR